MKLLHRVLFYVTIIVFIVMQVLTFGYTETMGTIVNGKFWWGDYLFGLSGFTTIFLIYSFCFSIYDILKNLNGFALKIIYLIIVFIPPIGTYIYFERELFHRPFLKKTN